ncbi:hypothetical protein JE959_001749 [Aeromonas veronii]|nr:hypothetical protein [Aeromonas veronii]
MVGKVLPYARSEPVIFRVYQDYQGDTPKFAIAFPSSVHYQEGANAMMTAVSVAEELIRKYTGMLAHAIQDKGEFAPIISMISLKEYDLAKLCIDMTDISAKNLTDNARNNLPFSDCESVLDVILKTEAFKPVLAVFKKRYGGKGADQITEAEQPLLELAESVFNAYAATMLPVEKAPGGVMVMIDVEIKRRKQQEANLRADFIKLA